MNILNNVFHNKVSVIHLLESSHKILTSTYKNMYDKMDITPIFSKEWLNEDRKNALFTGRFDMFSLTSFLVFYLQ